MTHWCLIKEDAGRLVRSIGVLEYFLHLAYKLTKTGNGRANFIRAMHKTKRSQRRTKWFGKDQWVWSLWWDKNSFENMHPKSHFKINRMEYKENVRQRLKIIHGMIISKFLTKRVHISSPHAISSRFCKVLLAQKKNTFFTLSNKKCHKIFNVKWIGFYRNFVSRKSYNLYTVRKRTFKSFKCEVTMT